MTWQYYYLVVYGLAIFLTPAIYPKMILNFKLGDKKRVTIMISIIGGLTVLYPHLTPSVYMTLLRIMLILFSAFGVFAELFFIEWNLPLTKKQKYSFNILFALTNLIQIIALISAPTF